MKLRTFLYASSAIALVMQPILATAQERLVIPQGNSSDIGYKKGRNISAERPDEVLDEGLDEIRKVIEDELDEIEDGYAGCASSSGFYGEGHANDDGSGDNCYKPPVCNSTTQKLVFDGTKFTCVADQYTPPPPPCCVGGSGGNGRDGGGSGVDVDGDGKADFSSHGAAARAGYTNGRTVNNEPAPGPEGPSGDKSDSRVLCGELHRQGLLPRKIYVANLRHYQRHADVYAARAYHAWAIPVVKKMQKSDMVTKLVKPWANAWAYQMAYEMGSHDKQNVTGWLMMRTIMPLHTVAGKVFFKDTQEDYIDRGNVLS